MIKYPCKDFCEKEFRMNALPRLKIAHLPTRLERMPRLSAELKGPKLWVKRDDQTGLAFGGNKTRKLEFLLAEAKANGAKTLVTAGAVQSNHCRQTAAAAARYGFDCVLLLAGKPPNTATANYRLDQILGAEIVWGSWDTRHDDLKEVFNQAWKDGRRPYLVPYGGSNATGAASYAYAIQELMEQDEIKPDWIVFPSSSGGTHAGMVAGKRIFGFAGQVLGISIDEPEKTLKTRVAGLASEVADRLGCKFSFKSEDVLANAVYADPGYGVLTDREREAIRLFARLEGLLLDPVYTGRAAAGMIDLIQKGFFDSSAHVVFWHTGGTPALFAEKYQDL
jgi:D-cysteine desulfhydrase family pyridoxal phosphate-dependent enzyme